MSKSLNFELGLSIIKAKKEVDKFVQDTNKKMGKLKTEITISRKNADKDAAKKEKEDYRIRLAQLKTEQEARESAAQAEIKRWEEGKKAAKEAHDARVKAAKNTAEEERKANEAVQKAVDKNHEKVRKDLEKENKAREDAATKRQTLAKKEFDAHQAELQKQQAAVKKHNEKIAEIRTASLARVDRMEIAAGGATLAARKKYALELERILATSNDRSLEDTRQMIRSLEAEYNKLNRMAIKGQNIQAAQMGGGLATRNIGRQVNVMFNIQQAIEDFSYAGMRGASNNLATMAASMGGPAGIAAMAGLAAYNIYQLGDAMGWFGKKAEEVNKSLSEQISFMRDLRDADRSRRDSFSTSSSLDSPDALRKETINLAVIRRQFAEAEKDAERLGNLERSVRDLSNVPAFEDLGEYSKRSAEINRLLEEHKDILGNINTKEFMDNADTYLKDITSSSKEAAQELEKRRRELYDIRNQIERMKRSFKVDSSIRGLEGDLDSFSLSGFNSKSLPLAKKYVEQFEKSHKKRLDTVKEEVANRKFAIALMEAEMANEADILKAKGELEQYLKDQKVLLEQTTKPAQSLMEALAVTYDSASDVADEVKRIADESHRAAVAAWDQVEAVKAAKLANQRSFESTVFGARNSILDKQAQEEIQKRQSQLGTVEGRQKYDEFWVKYMFGDSKRTQWLIKERAKLIGQFHSQAMQDIQTQVERERSKRADKLLNDRIGVLQDRSKSQTKAGDFQGSLTTLQEMQGLYLSAMGSAGSSAQMRSFLQRAEDVQKQMDAVHDKNIERETEAAEKATERARQAQELLDQSLKTKEAIESLDPNANGALDKLLQMQNMLEQMRLDAEGIKMSLEGNGVAFNGFGPIPGGNQVAGVGGGNNITNINVASINTNAANAGSLVTDLNAQAKRKGIMVG